MTNPNPIPRIDPEFKALIPPLSGEEYAQLTQNILAEKRCRDAIIIWDGVIVDGHNRFAICAAHDIPFEIKEMSFESREEAMVWILDNQLGRRNLPDGMKIELATLKTELLRQQAKENQKLAGGDKTRDGALLAKLRKQGGEPINTREAIAEEAGVGDGTVRRYQQLSQQPELQEAVKRGELTIGTAHRLLDSQILKQLKHIDKLYSYIKKHIPIQDDEAANQEIKEGLLRLQELLAQIQST